MGAADPDRVRGGCRGQCLRCGGPEETQLHAEVVLATSVGRLRWAASHLTIALLGTATLLLAAGLSAGLAHAAQVGDLRQAAAVLAGAMVQLPAAWVLAGIVMALFGLQPRLIAGVWATLVAFLLIGELGSLLGPNQWVIDLSPFTHLQRIPGDQFTVTPTPWLIAVCAALITAGLVGFHRHDLD
ncbi:MAG TPA: hypothetical protein VFN75_01540 [Pseudonocardiaceae bacterium]|nr:hypothetical protein [Pseudonocardiaceae bacterium]